MNSSYTKIKKDKYLSITNWWGNNIHFCVFLGCYTIVMVFLCAKMTIWEDEAYTLSTISNNISQVFHLSYDFEGQPPLYFLMLSFWQKISSSIFFSRLFSLIFIMLSAFILKKLAESIFNNISSNWIVVLFLINPYTVAVALEIRLYALLIFLSILEIYLYWLIHVKNKHKLKVLFIIVGILGVYIQYFFSFLILSFAILRLIEKGWKNFTYFCVWNSPVAFFFLPNLVFIADQYKIHHTIQVAYEQGRSTILLIFASPYDLLIRIGDLPREGNILGWIVRIFFLFSFLYSFFLITKSVRRTKTRYIFILKRTIILATVLFGLFLTAFTIAKVTYSSKYMTVLYPVMILSLLVYNILDSKTRNFFLFILFSYYMIVNLHYFSPPFVKVEDYKSLNEVAVKNEKLGEDIVLSDSRYYLCFKHYYTGTNRLISLQKLILSDEYYSSYLNDTIEFGNKIKECTQNANSFIFIDGVNTDYSYLKNLGSEIVNVYIEKRFKITLDTVIKGRNDSYDLRVRRLKKKYFDTLNKSKSTGIAQTNNHEYRE